MHIPRTGVCLHGRRIDPLSWDIDWQGVAKTLWTILNRDNAGDRLMCQLERRTEVISGDSNWQDVVQSGSTASQLATVGKSTDN